MHIHEFHHKFTSATEQSDLFQALRNLSQFEDAASLLNGEVSFAEWSPWPPVA